MPQHIGIIACTAEGAALCYRTICAEGALLLGPYAHPEVSIHTHSLADYVKKSIFIIFFLCSPWFFLCPIERAFV
jgi:hypothetical protein